MIHFTRVIPILLSSLVFIILFALEENISDLLSNNNDAWQHIFTAVFDWSAIQTGFMFGVYGFLIGSPNGFIKAIQKTKAFHFFKVGVVSSLFVGFILTFTSFPLLVIVPDPYSIHWFWKASIYAWLALFFFALLSFFRTAFVFAKITSQVGTNHTAA